MLAKIIDIWMGKIWLTWLWFDYCDRKDVSDEQEPARDFYIELVARKSLMLRWLPDHIRSDAEICEIAVSGDILALAHIMPKRASCLRRNRKFGTLENVNNDPDFYKLVWA